jgi:membrane protease YdiL (CAAX protease family)
VTDTVVLPAKIRHVGYWLLWLTGLVVAVVVLDRLAMRQLREHLAHASAQTLGALQNGDTPWRWSMRVEPDVIAGRAFGSSASEFSADGFSVRSEGKPFEVGLVLPHAIDLQRYSRIEGVLRMDQPIALSFSLRTHFNREICNSAMTNLAPSQNGFDVDLGQLAWQCAGVDAAAPARAAMFRLVIDANAGAHTSVSDIALRPSNPSTSAITSRNLRITLTTSSNIGESEETIDASSSTLSGDQWPIFAVPLDGRVEQILAVRDVIVERFPAALVYAAGDDDVVRSEASAWIPAEEAATDWRSWSLLTVYFAALLATRIKPPLTPKLRAANELVLVVGPPLALVIGGAIGDTLSLPTQLSLLATLIFSASLLFGAAPAAPTARTARRGSWAALLSVVVTVAIILILRDEPFAHDLPSASNIAKYLAWAAIQQFLICVIVSDRIERILGSSSAAVLIAAFIFALLHTPNAALMQFTFIGGLIWVWNWQHNRALVANILAHTACGILLSTQLPSEWLRSAEVSARFFL